MLPCDNIFISSPDSRRSLATKKVFLRPEKSSLGKQGSLFSDEYVVSTSFFICLPRLLFSHSLNKNNHGVALSVSGAETGGNKCFCNYRSKWILRTKHDTEWQKFKFWVPKGTCEKMTSSPKIYLCPVPTMCVVSGKKQRRPYSDNS